MCEAMHPQHQCHHMARRRQGFEWYRPRPCTIKGEEGTKTKNSQGPHTRTYGAIGKQQPLLPRAAPYGSQAQPTTATYFSIKNSAIWPEVS